MSWHKPYEIKGKSGIMIMVYVQPGASRTEVQGLFQDRLKIRLQAPPVDGAANRALTDFLSDFMGISNKHIHLLTGTNSRKKNLWIEGVSADQLQQITDQLKKPDRNAALLDEIG